MAGACCPTRSSVTLKPPGASWRRSSHQGGLMRSLPCNAARPLSAAARHPHSGDIHGVLGAARGVGERRRASRRLRQLRGRLTVPAPRRRGPATPAAAQLRGVPSAPIPCDTGWTFQNQCAPSFPHCEKRGAVVTSITCPSCADLPSSRLLPSCARESVCQKDSPLYKLLQ